ncbi:hypothetical protein MK163_00020 [bacterium]|nr:hypothetical protein [bacterium]
MNLEVIADHRGQVEGFREGDVDLADLDRHAAGGHRRRCTSDRGAGGVQGKDFNGVEDSHDIALAVYRACDPHRGAARGYGGVNGELAAPGRSGELQLLEGEGLLADDGFDRRGRAAVNARVFVE